MPTSHREGQASEAGVSRVGPRQFSQKAAALYLGVSVRWFRDNVHIEPIPVGPISAERRPLLRYLREDLDALVAQWKKRRTA